MQYLRTELHRQVYEVRGRNTVTTKLDAPYTLLSVQGQASRVPVRALNLHLQNLMPQEPSTVNGITKSATALLQKVPKVKDQEQEAQQLVGQECTQAERILAKSQRRTEEGDKLIREEQRPKKAEASKAQSEKDKEIFQIKKEARALTRQHPGISEKVARKIAKKVVKKAENEEQVYETQELANRAVEEANCERSLEGKVFMIHQKNRNEGKTDNDSAFVVRFTSQEQEPRPKVILQREGQKAPPTTIRRHFSLDPGDFYQKHGAVPEQRLHVNTEPTSERNTFRGNLKYEKSPPQTASRDSVPITMVESEGKSPGMTHIGKDGNVFFVRRHPTMNPFERLQAIEQAGEITSRDQAKLGLHGQYHLPLFPEDDLRKF